MCVQSDRRRATTGVGAGLAAIGVLVGLAKD